ncbi:MAG: protein kinase [Deltaproteobacteria bacterium]|nr:protein kinase [Deltaproteobacteria bacterium]
MAVEPERANDPQPDPQADAHAPTALAEGDRASRREVTIKGRKGATPRAERPPEAREPEKKDEGSIPLGELVGDRYKLVAHVGAGGQGEVWRAEDVVISGHVVALKMLFARANGEADRDLQLRELRMLASVSHPSVVQFKDHGWLGGRLWFVMPWYEGKDLDKSLPLERAEARRIFEQVAAGLAAVHAKGLRHQDIKPSNIFLAKIAGLEDTLPILLDFGVAATEDEILVAGSPQYFAPELARDWPTPSPDVGPPADVFALALSLRLALDPEGVPEVGAFDRESLARRAQTPIPPPSGPGLAFLAPSFERWLSIDPAKRPTAAELVRELAVLTEPEERSRERSRTIRRVAPWLLGGAILTTLGGLWGWEQIISARKAQAAELTERLEAEQRVIEEAQRVEQLGSALDDALARANQSSQRTTEALNQLDEAEAEIANAQGNAAQLRTARDRLHAALEEARTHAEAQQTAITEAHDVITRLGNDLAATRRQLEELRVERDGLRTTSEQQRTQLDQQRAQLESRQAQLDQQRAELESRQSQLDALRAERDTMRTERDAMRTERDAANAARASTETERDSLRASLESQRAETRAAEAEAARLRAAQASGAGAGSSGSSAGSSGGSGSATTEGPPSTTSIDPNTGARATGGVVIRPRTEADGVPTP